MKNNRHQIASHECDFHKYGAYQDAMHTGVIPCVDCQKEIPNLKALVKHYKTRHDMRGHGTEEKLRKMHGLPPSSRSLRKLRKRLENKRKEDESKESPKEADDGQEPEAEEDESLFVSDPPDDKPTDNGGNDRDHFGGGGGGLGEQILSNNVIACS